MTPGDAHDTSSTAASSGRSPGESQGTPARSPLTQKLWFRNAVLSIVALVSFCTTLLIAYELALARVPEHRLALERLVRAHTGLDIRFNELGFRWGWYGPEAVFRRVELGEPGRSNVLLRAPELIVGFDAWRTLQSGQLAAGRITLVAPDIDLERFASARNAAHTNDEDAVPLRAAVRTANPGPAVLLNRWRGGRIDLQGGTLRLPGLAGSATPVTLQIRRASLRHSDDEWNGFGLVFLPERLGRTARLIVQLQGDLRQPQSLNGALRFDGMRVAFAGWRDVLSAAPALARSVPTTGGGDVSIRLTLKNGRVEKADGQLRADGVTIDTPPWLDAAAQPALASQGSLRLEYVSGDWRFVRRGTGGQVQIEQLVLRREDAGSPLPRVSVEFGPGHVHGTVAQAPLRFAVALGQWLAPQLVPDGIVLKGAAENVDIDWNAARPAGEKLVASARTSDAGIATDTGSFAVSGLRTRLNASESRVLIDMDSPEARLAWSGMTQPSPEHVALASVLQINRFSAGWKLETSRLEMAHDAGQLVLSGSVTGDSSSNAPVLTANGTVEKADVPRLHALLANNLAHGFGALAARLSDGRIEDAKFELAGSLDALFASQAAPVAKSDYTFNGSLTLRDARIAAQGAWPEAEAVDAKLTWVGARIHASLDEGRAGAFQLDSVTADWDSSGRRESRVTGRARARLEEVLEWQRAHPELQEYVPHVQDLVARGDALFDFDVTVPATARLTPRATPPRTRTRIATVLEGVQFTPAPELPPVESLRGSLAFDSGHLQRSTFSATWLGGPLTLRLSERRTRGGDVMAVQAQGFIDASRLLALSQVKELAEVSGQTPWSGEFLYTPPGAGVPARWQGRAESSLIGIASELPAPFAKLAQTSVPLHVEISGTENRSDLRANLADRVRTAFALNLRNGNDWYIERGNVQLGGDRATLPAEAVVTIEGHVKKLDLPAYMLAWQQLRAGEGGAANSKRGEPSVTDNAPASIDLTADELALGNRVHLNASLRATPAVAGAEVRIESASLGVLTGKLETGTKDVVFKHLQLVRDTLTGEGSLHCAPALTTCNGKFELTTQDAAAALADLGFRPELSAAKGSLSGDVTWEPRDERPWLETATGQLSMRFDDGAARDAGDSPGRPFPLLTVPAFLRGIARPPADSAAPLGELRFTRLDAEFQLRNGYAQTSDLHFDGDAEILARGRTGLLARDYDYEAWVLRGEERIPASLRRLAATPRVAAAWMSLRDLIRGDNADRSRVVLHLRGSWSEPVVSVD